MQFALIDISLTPMTQTASGGSLFLYGLFSLSGGLNEWHHSDAFVAYELFHRYSSSILD
jgi:hypothetical protein